MLSNTASRGAPRARLAVALGGGGAFGIAFHLGIADALSEAGMPLTRVPLTGLSAGSYAAAALVTGTPLGVVAEAWQHVLASTGRGKLVRAVAITERAFGDARDPRVTGVALRLPTPRRVLLHGGRHRLADLVAASASPLGMAHGHLVDGRPLFDAGAVSNTAADLVPSADVLLVVAPLARGVLGWQGRIWEHRLRMETGLWRARHRGKVVVVRPEPEVIEAGGRSWRQMMNMSFAESTYTAARRQGCGVAERLRAVTGDLAAAT